jgi:PPOX class probable F420-dependent enzyme
LDTTDRSRLSPAERRFLAEARAATLVTIAPGGRPRPVPACFVLSPVDDAAGRPIILSPIDEKPKRAADPRDLARVRDLLARPVVSLLVHHWDEDWARLAWLRLDGTATLTEPDAPDHGVAVVALRRKYRQYVRHRLEGRPLIRIAVDRVRAWGAIGEPPAQSGSGGGSGGGVRR